MPVRVLGTWHLQQHIRVKSPTNTKSNTNQKANFHKNKTNNHDHNERRLVASLPPTSLPESSRLTRSPSRFSSGKPALRPTMTPRPRRRRRPRPRQHRPSARTTSLSPRSHRARLLPLSLDDILLLLLVLLLLLTYLVAPIHRRFH